MRGAKRDRGGSRARGGRIALAGVEFPVPFDEVVDAAAQVGRSLPPSLRETALGGLAITPTGKHLGAQSDSCL